MLVKLPGSAGSRTPSMAGRTISQPRTMALVGIGTSLVKLPPRGGNQGPEHRMYEMSWVKNRMRQRAARTVYHTHRDAQKKSRGCRVDMIYIVQGQKGVKVEVQGWNSHRFSPTWRESGLADFGIACERRGVRQVARM